MNIEEALVEIFQADATLNGLIGSRFYSLNVPQYVQQYPVLVKVLMGRKTTKIYEAPGRTALCESLFRFIAMSKGPETYASAKAVDDALRLCLEGFQGTVTDTGSPPTSIQIGGIFLADAREVYFDESQMFELVSEYLIHHTQPIRNV